MNVSLPFGDSYSLIKGWISSCILSLVVVFSISFSTLSVEKNNNIAVSYYYF